MGTFKTAVLGKGFKIDISPPTEPPFYMRSVKGIPKRKIKNIFHKLRAQLLITLGVTGFTSETRRVNFNRNVKRWQNALEQRRYLKKSKAYFSNNKIEEKYVYFPLHLQPEMTTDVLGGAYTDQLLALEVLREIVPLEIPIYVKDDLRPNFPPVLSRVRRIVIGLMRPCFASLFSSHIRRV